MAGGNAVPSEKQDVMLATARKEPCVQGLDWIAHKAMTVITVQGALPVIIWQGIFLLHVTWVP